MHTRTDSLNRDLHRLDGAIPHSSSTLVRTRADDSTDSFTMLPTVIATHSEGYKSEYSMRASAMRSNRKRRQGHSERRSGLATYTGCVMMAVGIGLLLCVIMLLVRQSHQEPRSKEQPSMLRIQVLSGERDKAVTVTTSVQEMTKATQRSGASKSQAKSLPAEFDWQAYLRWNPELKFDGISTEKQAKQHYLEHGHLQSLVYKDYNLTIRYTACGGLMNQHYSHISALTLAHLAHASRVIWPPMQERSSFNKRYHPNADKNEQTWVYLNASSLWNMPVIQSNIMEKFGIEVVMHPDNTPLPDMTKPDTAFQTYPLESISIPHDFQLRFRKPIYIARHHPYMLARAVMDAGRQVLLKHGTQPTSVIVDLPCALFMIDNRNLTVVEDIARLLEFSPEMTGLADKVISGMERDSGAPTFNGVHLRMEKDAADWAVIIGGRDKYWAKYKQSMVQAGFASEPAPLYVASGLLKAAREEKWSEQEMTRLTKDMLAEELTTKVVYKELYLSEKDLAQVSNEQSGLIDFLVMRRSKLLLGIGVSTFSFYLNELRLMDGIPPMDTRLLMLSYIGTDELFFSCGVTAIQTRQQWAKKHMLPDICKKPDMRPCFGKPAVGHAMPSRIPHRVP